MKFYISINVTISKNFLRFTWMITETQILGQTKAVHKGEKFSITFITGNS